MSSIRMVVSRVLWAGLVSLGLAACTSSFKSEVVSFHKLPPPHGERITIVPLDDKVSAGPEFEQYANLVGAKLGALGYTPGGTGEPDLLVKIAYKISEGMDRSRYGGGGYAGATYYYPYATSYGLGYSFYPFSPYFGPGYGYGYGYGFYPGYGGYNSYTIYTRSLEMKIETPDGKILYEGRSVSDGIKKNLPEIMPYLVEAMFTDFPGESGVTRKVRVELADGSTY